MGKEKKTIVAESIDWEALPDIMVMTKAAKAVGVSVRTLAVRLRPALPKPKGRRFARIYVAKQCLRRMMSQGEDCDNGFALTLESPEDGAPRTATVRNRAGEQVAFLKDVMGAGIACDCGGEDCLHVQFAKVVCASWRREKKDEPE